jgi:hypothetical protein
MGTVTTVGITPAGVVRAEVTGTGFFRSERDFFSAVGARQAQLLHAIVGTGMPAR